MVDLIRSVAASCRPPTQLTRPWRRRCPGSFEDEDYSPAINAVPGRNNPGQSWLRLLPLVDLRQGHSAQFGATLETNRQALD